MGFTHWDETSMGTGVASVDAQHKILIDMLNQFVTSAAEGKGTEELAKMVGSLKTYAVRHFAHEEGIMDQHHCPAASQNKIAHMNFLRNFNTLAATIERDGPSLEMVLDVQVKLVNWLTTHIKACDAQLRKCVAAGACAARA